MLPLPIGSQPSGASQFDLGESPCSAFVGATIHAACAEPIIRLDRARDAIRGAAVTRMIDVGLWFDWWARCRDSC